MKMNRSNRLYRAFDSRKRFVDFGDALNQISRKMAIFGRR